MSIPNIIPELIQRFDDNVEAYRSGQYNETQLRREFIDPFFEALGWDVQNKQGYAEAYKDVIHEDAIRIGGGTKAPDYCFRVGGARKFFLETKKPSINIRTDTHPAYQLRRYAWSAKLPLSILTDFEEFAVYDCRLRPVKNDGAAKGRIIYMTYKDYLERWDEITNIFSREAILKGAFDKYAESTKKKRGTAEVDNEFLKEIEIWRDLLAKNIALRNPDLTARELNFAVQRTIDRIIFLRICEDRKIETYGHLGALRNGANIYRRLCQLFQEADRRYNSGLFHFSHEKNRSGSPDELSLHLEIDDKVLKDLLNRMYYPESPYEFSVLPADILGQVYERFLGKVIRLTSAHRARIEEKPEVRKAGGVYYTPTYIVDYIVKNTVGKLLNGDNPKSPAPISLRKAAELRILDPACGSGSFLLGAYQYLLDWYRDQYVNDDPDKHARGRPPRLYKGRGGEWKLTTAERRRILLNNIYGVDIDPRAVEVTKLSLLLKVLEGETDQTLDNQLKFFRERALPDLGNNIKCGNSLISPDFYDDKQLELFDSEDHYRINAFDWESEFPEIMKPPKDANKSKEEAGFDAVIGNPPYIRIQAIKEGAPKEVEFYKKRYESARSGNYDIYVIFVEKGLSLLNHKGRLGFILPHKFFNAKYGEALREMIGRGQYLSHVVYFADQQVFPSASTYTCLMFLDKAGVDKCFYVRVNDLDAWRKEWVKLSDSERASDIDDAIAEAAATYRGRYSKTDEKTISGKIPTKLLGKEEWNFVVGPNAKLIERIHTLEFHNLGYVADIFVGLQTSADKVFVVPNEADIEAELTKPFLLTGKLTAYAPAKPSARLVFPYEISDGKAQLISADILKQKYPKGWAYLYERRRTLMNRERGKWQHDKWYAFGRSQNLTQMDAPKLIIQVTAQNPTVLLDETGLYMTGGGSGPFYGIRPKDANVALKYLLGIMNSKLFGLIVKAQSTTLRGGYIKFSKQYIESVPIPTVDFDNADEKAKHDQMVQLVDHMLKLHQKLQVAKTEHDKIMLQRQIKKTDNQIDYLVYNLYGLKEEEVTLIHDS